MSVPGQKVPRLSETSRSLQQTTGKRVIERNLYNQAGSLYFLAFQRKFCTVRGLRMNSDSNVEVHHLPTIA
jgi:hypothetical protein